MLIVFGFATSGITSMGSTAACCIVSAGTDIAGENCYCQHCYCGRELLLPALLLWARTVIASTAIAGENCYCQHCYCGRELLLPALLLRARTVIESTAIAGENCYCQHCYCGRALLLPALLLWARTVIASTAIVGENCYCQHCWSLFPVSQRLQLGILLTSLEEQHHVATVLGYAALTPPDDEPGHGHDSDTRAQHPTEATSQAIPVPSTSISNEAVASEEASVYIGNSLAEDLMHTLLLNLGYYAVTRTVQMFLVMLNLFYFIFSCGAIN